MIPQVDGYVTDVPYVHHFGRELMPAWLDHVALVSGLAPPERSTGFAWCDLGCGQGVTAAVVAATHPNASVYGIDAMQLHIENAQRLAGEAAIPNVTFHAADFASAVDLDLPEFDYIVSHGVYSWVNQHARDSWRRFIDRHLKPGGLVYVSYNAMPGRAADLPFQRLLRALGQSFSGDSGERVAAALKVVRALADLKAPALLFSPMAGAMKEPGKRSSTSYLVHEFMGAGWEPLCVTDVRAAMSGIGLTPAGSATLMENYDSFVLGHAAREILGAIGDRGARELARDFLINQSFRRDVFIRGGRSFSQDEGRRRLLACTYALSGPAAKIEFTASTPAGRLSFDNPVARHIVNGLTAGPRRLADLAEDSIADQDLLANALVLCAANALWPVESSRVPIAKVNRAIYGRLDGPEELDCLALPFGTALAIEHDQLIRLRDGDPVSGDEFSSWVQSQMGHSAFQGLIPPRVG